MEIDAFQSGHEAGQVDETFADDDVMVRFVLMVFEIFQMDGEDAFRPAFDGFDGVEIGVLRPGGVEAEADAFGRVLEDEIEHGLRTEPMPAAVVVDGEADVVFRRQFFGEFEGLDDILRQVEIAGHRVVAEQFGEFKAFAHQGFVSVEGRGEIVGDRHTEIRILFNDGLEVLRLFRRADADVGHARFEKLLRDGRDAERLEITEAVGLDGEFLLQILHDSLLFDDDKKALAGEPRLYKI